MDPFSGTPFPDNIIPTSRLSPQALAFLQFEPQPNTVNGALQLPADAVQRASRISATTRRASITTSPRATCSPARYLFNDTYEASIPYLGPRSAQ